MNDGPGLVREELEVDRLSAVLADRFRGMAPDMIEHRVREEFGRWSAVPVHDFVPIFVERNLRGELRALTG